MDDLRAALGHRVKELREGLGLSQQQLAEQADLDITYISGIERGASESESEHAGARGEGSQGVTFGARRRSQT